jgi:DNA-directed RNA polymerase alpha subunit
MLGMAKIEFEEDVVPEMLRVQPFAPKIEIVKLDEEEIRFLLTGVDTSMANSLRRIMLAEVPTVAIDEVEIECNTSVRSSCPYMKFYI